MLFNYLWTNRERPRLGSKRFLKVLIKRFVTLPILLDVVLRRKIFQVKGSSIGVLTVIEKINLNGLCSKFVVGERSFIAKNVHVALHETIVIGNNVVINSNVQLLTGSHDTRDPNWTSVAKPIIINDYSWVAYNAIILPGVTLGRGAVVGAGAVVSKDVPEYAIVAGNPATIVGQRCKEFIYSPVDLFAPYEAWLGNPIKYKNAITNFHSENIEC